MWQSQAMAEEQLLSLMCVSQSVMGTNAVTQPSPQAAGALTGMATFLCLKVFTLSVLLGPAKAPENGLDLTPTPGPRPTITLSRAFWVVCALKWSSAHLLSSHPSKAQLYEAHDHVLPLCCKPCGLSSCLVRSFWAGLFLIPPSPVPSTDPVHQGSRAPANLHGPLWWRSMLLYREK